MATRRLALWRIHVYTNNLYSEPLHNVKNCRDVNPLVFRHEPDELHRVMDWVNRDIGALVCSDKSDVVLLYDWILLMLPKISMESAEFKENLLPHLGKKTSLFIHELLNYARSPYQSIISYECNAQYRALEEPLLELHSTSAEAQTQRLGIMHNFIEFSSKINDDCYDSFDEEFEIEAEEQLDEVLAVQQLLENEELQQLGEIVEVQPHVYELHRSMSVSNLQLEIQRSMLTHMHRSMRFLGNFTATASLTEIP